jgi:hypothetical protein
MRRLVTIVACSVAMTVVGPALAITTGAMTKAGAQTVPAWLVKAQRLVLKSFPHSRLVHTHHIWYRKTVAVIFEFRRVAVCGGCTAPSQSMLPRGRIVRVAFSRVTHRPLPGFEFCEVHGSSPPRKVCMRR